MKQQKQLSLFLENKPGVLAGLCQDLAARGVNVLAITVADHIDHAVVRMVVDQPRKALHLLGEAGLLVIESEVISVNLPDRPGALGTVARKLAKARVNIDYAYGSAGSAKGRATVFLHVSDPKKACAALRR